MQTVDVVAVGEAVLDVFVSLSLKGNDVHTNKEKNELTLSLGGKIPVEKETFSLGGNATHVAIGISRLGFRAALAVEVGTDEFSEKILHDLDKEKVDKSLLKQTSNIELTCNVSISAGEDRTILAHHIEREQDFSFHTIQTQWVFLTSMGEKWENAYAKTLQFVKQTGAHLAFNPGGTQLRKGVESFLNILKVCEILFVNKEEAEQILYGKVLPPEKKESTEALLFRLQRMGPKTVVITDGKNGSYAIDANGQIYTQAIFPEKVTETTGAGDAFSTGFLAALLSGKDIPTALLWGTADAAGVVGKHGGQEGLLTKNELEHMIQKNS